MTDRILKPSVIAGLCVGVAVFVVAAVMFPRLLEFIVGNPAKAGTGALGAAAAGAEGYRRVRAGRKRAAAGAADVSEANREAVEATKAAETRAEAVNDAAEAGDGNDRIRV